MSQSHATLGLHERVLADLDQREAALAKQEADARKVLEEALAHCAAMRMSIEQDRAVLMQAAKLYRRFLDTGDGGIAEDSAGPREQTSPGESSAFQEPAPSSGEPSLMQLRRQLWNENQMDEVEQRKAWAAGEPPPGAPVQSY